MTIQLEIAPHDEHSDFAVLEIEAMTDIVGRVMGDEDLQSLLGKELARELGPVVDRRELSTSALVRLAFLQDAARVAEAAIVADGVISLEEVRYAYPLARALTAPLAAVRADYEPFDPLKSADVDRLLRHHRNDRAVFGGACPSTEWLGLEIARRIALERGDRGALERYEPMVLRLMDEIIRLGGETAKESALRDRTAELLRLRARLSATGTEAADVADPRALAFCRSDAPEVFSAIAHAPQVFRRDPFDVPTIHTSARELFERQLDRSRERGRALVLLGESGAGKTHLMRAFRTHVHERRLGYVGYMQMSSASDDYGRYALVKMLDSLERPYDEPEVLDSGLLCLSDAVLAAANVPIERLALLRDGEPSDDELATIVGRTVDGIVRDRRFADLDLDLLRALVYLQRRDASLDKRVLKLLRCEPLDDFDRQRLGGMSARPSGDALRILEHLGHVIARVGEGSMVLLLDQLEDIYSLDEAKTRFQRAMHMVRHVIDNVPSAVVVIACLEDFYQELRKHLSQTVLDRLERDPEPLRLLSQRAEPEIEAMIARRLGHFYEVLGVRPREDDPLFPFGAVDLSKLVNLRTRDVLDWCRSYQEKCIEAGQLVATDGVGHGTKPPVLPPPPVALEQLWNDFLVKHIAGTPEEEETRAKLLASSILAAREELPPGVRLNATLVDGAIAIEAPTKGGGSTPVLGAITDKHAQGGWLARQVTTLFERAKKEKRVLVLVRSSAFPSNPASQIAQVLGNVITSGGRRVVVTDAEWRAMTAYRAFRTEHGKNDAFASWLRTSKPLTQLPALRTLLALPDVTEGGDAILGTTRASTRPPSSGLLEAIVLPNQNGTVVESNPVTTTDPKPVDLPKSHELRLGVTRSAISRDVGIDPDQLRKHAAFLGASGSGKTSVALNLMEQLAERGIPAILVDRKGDLAGYASNEFWASEESDPARAKRKAALRDVLDVKLFTPGHPEGRSLWIPLVPGGLAQLPSHERSQAARYSAEALGAMMSYRDGGNDRAKVGILTKAIQILGELHGDSYEPGVGALIELVHSRDPSLVDAVGYLDEKHFKKLDDDLATLRIARGDFLKPHGERLRADALFGLDGTVPKGKVRWSIISTKFIGDASSLELWVSRMLVELSRWASAHPSPTLQAVALFDEADLYMPATSKPATKEPMQDLLKRARSAGLGLMLATQSPGDLDYKSRDNIGTWLLGRVSSTTAIAKMKPLLSECRTNVASQLATTGVGEFFLVHDGEVSPVRTERAVMSTQQLAEHEILALARTPA